MQYDFDDPGDMSVWEVGCDPDHPVSYDFDCSRVVDVVFITLCVLYVCVMFAAVVLVIVCIF